MATEAIESAEQLANLQLSDAKSELVCVEIGGAGGITKALRPHWTISDIRACEGVDLIADAARLPFLDSSVDLVLAIDVLHHISDFEGFVSELNRVLSPQGLAVFREPYWGVPAQIIWRFLHPEDFSLRNLKKENKFLHPMDGNQALAWSLLRKRDWRQDIVSKHFILKEVKIMTGISFVISGGATFTTKVPRKFLLKIHQLELRSKIWSRIFGMSILFSFSKRDI